MRYLAILLILVVQPLVADQNTGSSPITLTNIREQAEAFIKADLAIRLTETRIATQTSFRSPVSGSDTTGATRGRACSFREDPGSR